MGKCLITKLQGVVSNNNLKVLGAATVAHLKRVDNPSEYTQSFNIGMSKGSVAKIIGDGYFTDRNLTQNKGKELILNATENSVYVSNTDCDVIVLDKYSINQLKSYAAELPYPSSNMPGKTIDIDDLKYSSIQVYDGNNCNSIGSIDNLRNSNLLNLNIEGKGVFGNITSLSENTSFREVNIHCNNVNGNISFLSKNTSCTSINIYGTPLTGDVVNLKDLNKLVYCELYANAQSPIFGNIEAFKNCADLQTLVITESALSGDLAILPAKLKSLALNSNTISSFTWSNRPSTSTIFTIDGNIAVDNIDKMLQDLAQCQAVETSNKVINVKGTRTSASNSALSTLQSKGYTVSITPVS